MGRAEDFLTIKGGNMRHIFQFLIVVIIVSSLQVIALEGYYMDVFVDEGVSLGGPSRIPAISYVNMTHEWLNISSNKTAQNKVMVENDDDDNGALLYPDRQPRFAVIYSHGGSMSHASSLGSKGKEIIRDHYFNGGSHFGSCAGSFMLSTQNNSWYGFWDGYIQMSSPYNVGGAKVDAELPDDSPLLNYYDFGGDKLIESISHNNGGCIRVDAGGPEIPEGTEVLCLHANVTKRPTMNGHISCWAWKDNDTTGRVLGITSHPEGSGSGEKRDYMAACLLHSVNGLGLTRIKGELSNKVPRIMNKESSDNDPLFTKIGDKQYHHFFVDLPSGGKNISFQVDGEDGIDLHLFAKVDSAAFLDNADYKETSSGPDKKLEIDKVSSCKLYVSIKCATTVTSTRKTSGNDYWYEYSGNTKVLNGVEYTITGEWAGTGILSGNRDAQMQTQLTIKSIGQRVVFNIGRNVQAKSLKVYNLSGKECWKQDLSADSKEVTWNPGSAGIYIAKLQTGNKLYGIKRLTVLK